MPAVLRAAARAHGLEHVWPFDIICTRVVWIQGHSGIWSVIMHLLIINALQEWMMTHKGKKDALDAESKRKEGVRNAVELAAAAYEEAKKVLKKASADRRAAVKASNDPPPSVGVCLPVIECIDYTLAIHIVYKGCCWSEASIRHRLCALLAGSFKHL